MTRAEVNASRMLDAEAMRSIIKAIFPAYLHALSQLQVGEEDINSIIIGEVLEMERARQVEFADAAIALIGSFPPKKIPKGYAEAAARQTQLSRILKNNPELGARRAIGLVNLAVNGRVEVISSAISDFREEFDIYNSY